MFDLEYIKDISLYIDQGYDYVWSLKFVNND